MKDRPTSSVPAPGTLPRRDAPAEAPKTSNGDGALRVYLESLGCRLNAAEVERLARQFAGAGHAIVSDPNDADLLVLNTCAVTSQASRTARHRLRALHRASPQADIAVTGCWATEDAERAQAYPGVSWVVLNADKQAAVEEILGHDVEPAPWRPGRWGHTRAFLGVQEGCDHACTYCVTRLLRGSARSRPLADAVAEVQSLVEEGAQEVVLTGISLGAYGHDVGLEWGLATLVSTLLRETDVPWLRLSSVEPWDVDLPLLKLLDNPRLCRQLHLPLQSGSNRILRRMGRRITPEAFAALVRAARDVAPDIAITTDVIAGFPGEQDADFAATYDYIQAMQFARLHVFSYSERAGTPAVKLPGRVPKVVRKARAKKLRKLGRQLVAAYHASFVGQSLPVLWMRRRDDGIWSGLTGNYLKVRAPSDRDLWNRIVPTRFVSTHKGHLDGEVFLD